MHKPAPLMSTAGSLIEPIEAALAGDAEDQAVAFLQACSEGSPLSADDARRLAVLARSIDRNDLALEALAAGPESAESRLLAFQLRAEAGDEVADELAAVLGPDIRPGPSLLQLVGAFDLEGRGADAIDRVAAAVNSEPDWVAGHQTLAQLRWQAGEASPSRSFGDALERQPDNELLWAAWLGTVVRTSDWPLFERIARDASSRFSGSHLIAMVCADGYSEMGSEGMADHLFDQLAGIAERDFDSARMRHAMRYRRFDQAIRLGERAITTHGAAECWAWLGSAWRLAGDPRGDWFYRGTELIEAIDLQYSPAELSALAAVLRGLHRSAGPPLGQSPRGGTQTPGPLLKRRNPEIRLLRARLRQAVRGYVDRLPPPDPRHPFLGRPRRAFRFEGAWSIRLRPGGRHVSHIHSHGWISSALYVALPEGMSESPAGEGWLQFGVPPLPEEQPRAEPLRKVAPVAGRLALFPSLFWHGTSPFSDGERLTVAFDVVGR